MYRLIFAGLFPIAATTAAAQPAPPVGLPEAVRAAGNAITKEQLARDLAVLAQDAWNGRASLSPGLDSAAGFIIARLTRAGLKPLGDSGTFRQYYTVREGTADGAGRYLEIGGTRYRGSDVLAFGWSGPWSATGPLVYVGHGHRYPEGGIDPYASVDVRGKIVLAHFGAPFPSVAGRPPAGALPSFRAALERGALGMVLLPDQRILTRWAVMAAGTPGRYRELDPPVPSAYALRSQRAVVVRPAVAEALLAGSGLPAESLMARAARGDYPASFELPGGRPVTIQVPAASEREHRGYNVVAVLEGSDPVLRNEYVTVAAHLDGAVGRAAGGDTVWNAADDNATGSAAILRIAEELARAPRPRRSIIFIWDSGEEVGLWGTRSFVGRPVVPLERIVAHFNIDMIGATRAPGSPDSAEADVMGPNEVLLIGPGVLSTELDSLLVRTNRDYVNMRLNREHDREGSEFFYPRTDAGPFLERGIPTIGFFTGLHARYHLPSDEAGYLDPGKMEAVARTVLASVWMVADLPERPRMDKGIPASVPRHR